MYNDEAPSKSFITNWIRSFKLGRNNLEDEARSGRPSNTEEGKYDLAVLKIIKTEPTASLDLIAKTMRSSKTKTRNYINEKLSYKKVSCKWVPHRLTEKQKTARVDFCKNFLSKYGDLKKKSTYNIVTGDETWISTYDPYVGSQAKVWTLKSFDPISVCRKSRNEKKVLTSVFFSRTGIKNISFLDVKETATAKWYKNLCLEPLLDTWQKEHLKSCKKNFVLNHDNAPIHKASIISQYIDQNKIKLLAHPPYSPDLAPCDFWLFPNMKQRLRGKKYIDILDVKNEFQNFLNNLEKKDFDKCFSEWIKRCKGVIHNGGDYY